jgi:hypothetical protein
MTVSTKGASRRLPMIDKQAKMSSPMKRPLLASEMPASSGKPKADWPSNPTKFESGKARSTFRGPLPSREAPPR